MKVKIYIPEGIVWIRVVQTQVVAHHARLPAHTGLSPPRLLLEAGVDDQVHAPAMPHQTRHDRSPQRQVPAVVRGGRRAAQVQQQRLPGRFGLAEPVQVLGQAQTTTGKQVAAALLCWSDCEWQVFLTTEKF